MATLVIVGAGGLITWALANSSQKRLEDPHDHRTVHLHELLQLVNLSGPGRYRVTIYRQSGNIHAVHDVAGGAASAVEFVLSTFRRAGIPGVNIQKNTEDALWIARLYLDSSGRAPGKKIGRARIERLV